MEQQILINEANRLLSQASERVAAGHPDHANLQLIRLRDFLNGEQLGDAPAAPPTPEAPEATEQQTTMLDETPG